MNRFPYYIIVSFSLLFIFPFRGQSQERELLSENMVVTAVTKLNEGEIDSAIRLLETSIEQAPDNDAAYYYLSL